MNEIEYILRIVLKARDEMAKVFAASRMEMRRWSQDIKMTSRDLDGMNAKISSLTRRLGSLSKRFDETGASIHRFASQKRDADDLIDRNIRLFNAFGNAQAGAAAKIRESSRAQSDQARETRRLSREHDRAARSSRNFGDNVATLDNKLRGIGLLAAAAAAQQLTTVAIGLGGSLVAVAGSAAMAGGALAGSFAAGAAQAIPSVLLLSAAIARVTQVMDAVDAAQKLQQANFVAGQKETARTADTTDTLANAQDGLTSAMERQGDANRGITRAREDLGRAEEQLGRARKDAKRDLDDLVAAERAAELAAKGAALSQKEAQRALQEAIRGGDTLEVERAQLTLAESRDRVEESITTRQRARQDASRAQRGGVEGMEEVKAAKEQVEQARESVADARRSAEDAERAVTRAGRGIKTAQRNASEGVAATDTAAANLEFIKSQLSDSELELFNALERIKGTYKEVFRPITDTIIDSFTRTVNKVDEVIQMPNVVREARRTSKAIAGAIDEVVDSFSDDKTIGQMVRIGRAGRENIGPLTDIANDLGHAFLNIAEAGGPAFRRLIGYVGDLVGDFKDLTDNTSGLTDFFLTGEKHLESWLDLGVSVIKLFASLTGAGGAESGLSLVQDLTKYIDGLTQKIHDNEDEVRAFFRDSEGTIKQVGRVVEALAIALFDLFDPDKVEAFADFFVEILIPTLKEVIGTVSGAVNLLLDLFTANDVTIFLSKVGFGIILFSQIASSVTGAYKYFSEHIKLLSGFVRNVGGLGGKLADGLRHVSGAADVAAQKLGLMLEAIGKMIGRIPGLRRVGRAIENVGVQQQVGRQTGQRPGTTFVAGPGGVVQQLDERGRPIGQGAQQTGRFAATRTAAAGAGAGALGILGGPAGLALIGAVTTFALASANKQSRGENRQQFVQQFTGRMQTGTPEEVATLTKFLKIQRGELDLTDEKYREFREQHKELLAEAGVDATLSTQDIEDLGEAYDDIQKKQQEAFKGILKERRPFLDRLKISGDDILDGNTVSQVVGNLQRMGRADFQFDNIKDARRQILNNLDLINAGFQQGSDGWYAAVADNMGKSVEAISRGMKDGSISQKRGMNLIKDITRDNMRDVRDNIANMSEEAQVAIATNFRQARLAIERQTGGWRKATADELKEIRKLMRAELEIYGLSPEQARRLARNRTTPGRGDVDQWGRHEEPGGQGGQATGGIIGGKGSVGQRGSDVYKAWIGRGEMVLNNAHQKYIDPAMQWFYGHPLGQTFDRIRGIHAGGGNAGLGFAGGYAGRTPSGGRTVAIPGFPGEFINRTVLGQALALVKRFNLFITDAFATSGHVGAGHLQTGTAMDVVPGPGGSWDMVDRAVSFARSKGLTVLYNGVPNHGRGNHAHIELIKGILKDATASADRDVKKIPRRRLRGPDSVLKDIGQAAIDNVRDAANQTLKRATRRSGAAGPEGKEDVQAMSADVNVIRAFRRAIQRTRPVPQKAQLALWMAGIVESGLRNLDYGDADSEGALQLRVGLHGRGLARNPLQAAIAFLTRGFFGKGGAIALARANPDQSAGWVAQQVQGSDFPGRYDQVRSQAMRYLGFMLGGPVPGFGGGDRNMIAVEGGEHVITKDEVRAAGGHGVIAALRTLWGGGRQGGPFGYAEGGGVLQVGDSLSVGMREALKKLVDNLVSDVKVGRSSDEAFDVLKEKLKKTYRAVIFDVGTNDAQASTLHKNLKRAYALLDKDQQLVVSKVSGPGAAAKNRVLRRFARRNENVTLVDPTDIPTGPDSIHMTPEGYRQRARTFAKSINEEDKVSKKETKGIKYQTDLSGLSTDTFRAAELSLVDIAGIFMRMGRLKKITEKVKPFIDLMGAIVDDGGVLDQLRSSIERRIGGRAQRFARRGFSISGGVVARTRDDVGQAQGELGLLRAQRPDLIRERDAIEESLAKVQRRQGRSDLTNKQKQLLQNQENKLRERLAASRQAITDNISSIYDAQVALAEAIAAQWQKMADDINSNFERIGAGVDIQKRVASALGQDQQVLNLNSFSRGLMSAQINQLQDLANRASAAGQNDLVNTLATQIQDLKAQIIESMVADIRTQVDLVNTRAQRRLGRIDLGERLLNATGVLGTTAGTVLGGERFTRAGLFAQRGVALATQRQGLVGQLSAAQAVGATGLVEELTDAILELDVTIAENTQAAFNARVEEVNRVANTGMTFNDLNKQVIELTDELAGTRSTQELLANAQERGNILSTQRLELEKLLAEADAAGNAAASEDLRKQLLENEIATLQNTKAIQELTGTTNVQDFSTTLWQRFRQAIFSGVGAVLPQYPVPSAANGAYIMRSGMIAAHTGEVVVPANVVPWNNDMADNMNGKTNINITQVKERVDPVELARTLEWHRKLS